jgi:hypothetical protein
LPYVWGHATRHALINVNGISFGVTDNLYNALSALSPTDLSDGCRILWVDAISINQDDIEERNHQILRMKDIFSSASRVVVWLGSATPGSKDALDYFNSLSDDALTESALIRSHPNNTNAWLNLGRDILDREWWTRVWIIQEAVLAREIVVVCGSQSTSWKSLSWLVKIALRRGFSIQHEDIAYAGDFLYAAQTLDTYRTKYKTNGPMSFGTLVNEFHHHHSTLPIDRIYGIMGIARNLDSWDTKPDYSLNPVIAYMDMTQRRILRIKSLDSITLGRGCNRLQGRSSKLDTRFHNGTKR